MKLNTENLIWEGSGEAFLNDTLRQGMDEWLRRSGVGCFPCLPLDRCSPLPLPEYVSWVETEDLGSHAHWVSLAVCRWNIFFVIIAALSYRRSMCQWAFPPNLGLGHRGINWLSPGRCFLECEIQARLHSWRWRWRSPQIAHGVSYTWMPRTTEKPRLEIAVCTTSKLLFPVRSYLRSAPAFAPSRPVSRCLTAQDCALLIFPPLLCTCPSLSPGPLLHPQTHPKPLHEALARDPSHTGLTSFYVSTVDSSGRRLF